MREQVELQSNQLGLLHRYRYNAPNAHSQIQIQCNGCPSIFFYFAFFCIFSLLSSSCSLLLLLDKGQHAKCKASIRYVLVRFQFSALGSPNSTYDHGEEAQKLWKLRRIWARFQKQLLFGVSEEGLTVAGAGSWRVKGTL